MIQAVFILGGIGVLVGIGLALASKVFYVYVDPQILAVDDVLPGANCGGCGLPGCSANAEAIVKGQAAPNSCVAAGPETAEAIAAILGVAIEAKEPDIALPGCTYGVDSADTKFIYNGITDCRGAALLSGGMKICNIGCLGLGSCATACPFNAIVMGPDGLPVVDEKLCTGCGTCERVCPKHIIKLSSVTRRILREYTIDDCTTPCQRACPAGINISEYIRQITLGDYRRSVQVIKERNPFPTVIGRICPRPCEEDCRRKYIDEPVAINFLKRFAADYERASGERVQPFCAPATGRKIAVVGGGVQGLSVAFFAARLGHAPTVLEATDHLGGLLKSAISRYRLSTDILDWDIQGVLELGVEAKTGQMLGKDFTIADLLADGYEAVFLASGGWDSKLLRTGGGKTEQSVPGTYLLIDLLNESKQESGVVDMKADVVIYGGSTGILDAALVCRQMGAENVTVLLKESAAEAGLNAAALENVRSEGIQIVYGGVVTRLVGCGRELEQVEYQTTGDGALHTLATRTLFLASGRIPELIFKKVARREDASQESDAPEKADGPVEWEGLCPYKRPAFKDEAGLLAAGDELTDFSAAIKAIGAGRRAAASIHQVMYDLGLALAPDVMTPASDIQNVFAVEHVPTTPRQIMPVCSGTELEKCGDLELGFAAEAAAAEAGRCLQCGLICYKKETGEQIREATPVVSAAAG
ncbi:MAG: FAD-dependent oxidoreductase [Desulfobacterales bacterium]|nr:FAD-dependent oxidoreductase [Desulfobacterales bacterium]